MINHNLCQKCGKMDWCWMVDDVTWEKYRQGYSRLCKDCFKENKLNLVEIKQ